MTQRLDNYLVHSYDISSRTKAQALISQGLVLVDGKKAKASLLVDESSAIQILEHDEYVSRGAYKLLDAIESFNLDFKDKIVLDVGASTGGFTQVALNHGAKKVYALDIGKNELDSLLANDPRVVNMSGKDIRALTKADAPDVNLVIGDLSFISLTKVLPVIKNLYGIVQTMFLFKPQFECGMQIAKKYRGVIKDKFVHEKLLKEFVEYCSSINFPICNISPSPITGGDGNHEYLILFNSKQERFDIAKIVEKTFGK